MKQTKLKKATSGRRSKLCIEDRLLMALEYLREYRTYFHISQSYGVSESTTYKIIKWIEETLIKHPHFALPGKNVIGLLKKFKIIADKYRNRRKCFSLRFNFIKGIYNFELLHEF